MIIPVRCFTCGNVLANKYIAYVSTVQDEKNKVKDQTSTHCEPATTFIDLNNPVKSIEGKVLDELGLHKYCCRRMFISNVHLVSNIS
jgi:DNA-directed RNA polymerase subunit N (RpoN/RPB10)